MGHFKTLSLKILLDGLPLFLIVAFLGRTDWISAVVVTLVLTVIAYVVGDMVLLPETGNFTATVGDGAISLFLLWISRYLGVSLDFKTIIAGAAALVIVEGLVYHPYLKRLVTADSMGPRFGSRD